jgi:hypothetical protein
MLRRSFPSKDRGEGVALAFHPLEDGRKLLLDDEEPLVGDALGDLAILGRPCIAHMVDEALARIKSGSPAILKPGLVETPENRLEGIPTGPLSAFSSRSTEDAKQVRIVS